ncbi:MAG: LON peptidase substrate-binding domain-containing protein [Verrucomicrobiota bacterium]
MFPEFSDMPEQVPVMTLPGTVLFPQAMLPLYIFEPRYRKMLSDVLQSHRIFAIAALQPDGENELELDEEPVNQIATIGMVRACQKNDDGTANLILQGIERVRLSHIVQEEPYRLAAVELLESIPGAEPDRLCGYREQLEALLQKKKDFGGQVPCDVLDFLRKIGEPSVFVDMAAFALTADLRRKQELLETLEIRQRYKRMIEMVKQEIMELELLNKVRGSLSDDDIARN